MAIELVDDEPTLEVIESKRSLDPLAPEPDILVDDDNLWDEEPADTRQPDDTVNHGLEDEARRIYDDLNRTVVNEEQTKQQKAFLTTAKENCDLKLERLQEKLIAAKEEGDTKAEVTLEREINAIETEKGKIGTSLSELENPQKPQETPMEAARWMAKNPWFRAPKNDAEAARQRYIINFASKEIAQRHDPKSPDFYRELDKMVNQFEGKPSKRPSAPVMAPAGDMGKPDSKKKDVVRVPKREYQVAERMFATVGMDIKEPKVAAEYAKQRKKSGL